MTFPTSATKNGQVIMQEQEPILFVLCSPQHRVDQGKTTSCLSQKSLLPVNGTGFCPATRWSSQTVSFLGALRRDNGSKKPLLLVYADWCGPCKMMAPAFESLATKFSKPGKISFAKIDVDSQKEIAQRYGVRAMPTFKIIHNNSVVDTIQGADRTGLNNAVERAVKLAGSGGGSSFSGKGHTLGGSSVGSWSRTAARAGHDGRTFSVGRPWRFDPASFFDTIWTFFALYLVTLFSLDPYKTAEQSQFNVNRVDVPRSRAVGGGSARPTGPNMQKPRIQTLADL